MRNENGKFKVKHNKTNGAAKSQIATQRVAYSLMCAFIFDLLSIPSILLAILA